MRAIIVIGLVLLITGTLSAQDRHWSQPDHLVAQYAGSIGFASGGVGYNVFKGRARASVHFGHVPKRVGGPLNIVATKLIFVPQRYRLSKNTTINPFDVGLMVSYHLGEDFQSRWPEHQYPKNYYWWQTSFRAHLNFESSLTFKLRDYTTFKAITGYIELNSNDLYLVSLFQNRHATMAKDVLMVGLGTRFHF